MNILIYVWSLSNGGAERVASLWAEGFAKRGNQVSVMLGSFCSRTDYCLPSTIKIIRQSPIYDLWQRLLPRKIKDIFFKSRYCDFVYNAFPELLKNWFTSRIIRRENPDVIIVVMPCFFKRIQGALKFLYKNIPVVVTDHNAYERPDCAPFSKEQYVSKFEKCKDYDCLTVLTDADRLVLCKKMNEQFMKKVFVLPNPLTYEPQISVPKKEKFIFAAGRMDVWHCKGFDLLLRAWSKIRMSYPDWKLKIAGGGDTTILKKMCSELNVDNSVEFLGFVDVKKYYERASVFVLSSRYDGFGMVLIEAMSQGCACIACDFKGRQSEIIENENQGVICPIDDVESLANALDKVLSNDDYRILLQKNAIERSKNYSLSNIMILWDEIFDKIRKNTFN